LPVLPEGRPPVAHGPPPARPLARIALFDFLASVRGRAKTRIAVLDAVLLNWPFSQENARLHRLSQGVRLRVLL
jgi:hypothetical protein